MGGENEAIISLTDNTPKELLVLIRQNYSLPQLNYKTENCKSAKEIETTLNIQLFI